MKLQTQFHLRLERIIGGFVNYNSVSDIITSSVKNVSDGAVGYIIIGNAWFYSVELVWDSVEDSYENLSYMAVF